MNIKIKTPEQEKTPVKLGTLKPGEMFRFPETSLEQTVNNDDGSLLYMTISEKKDGRVEIFPLSGSSRIILKKDDDRFVIKVNYELMVWE